MRHWLVGGCVRDQVFRTLGVQMPPGKRGDVDHMLVDPDPEGLRALGLDPFASAVGHDFPVRIHPLTGEEYAFARRDKKAPDVATGYHGFIVDTQGVTAEEDLGRRDLTVNAMAQDPVTGDVLDPHGGQRDAADRLFRHVARDTFPDDPTRVLKLARHLAEFTEFRVAPETQALCAMMASRGDLAHLTPERVTKELAKALAAPQPSRFFAFLREIGALQLLFPELDALIGVEQPPEHHPEGDAYNHTMLCVDTPAPVLVRFALLCHDMGKALTPRELWPLHKDHAETGMPVVTGLCGRLRVSREWADLAGLATEMHMKVRRSPEMRPGTILEAIKHMDGLRNPGRMSEILAVALIDQQARPGHEDDPAPWFDVWADATRILRGLDLAPIAQRVKAKGGDVASAIRQTRIEALKAGLSR